MQTEIVQTRFDGVPTWFASAPIENRTSAGTPLAMKKTSTHDSERFMVLT